MLVFKCTIIYMTSYYVTPHVAVITCLYFFKKINNLLYRAYRQTVVATFVTTYKRMKLHGKEKEKEKEKENKKRKKKET